MKNTKQVYASGLYVFSGSACGNSSFIETEDEAKIFMKYLNYFTKGYLSVYDFNINQYGWNLVVKLNSEKAILSKFILSRNSISEWEVWRIISERIRLCLSTYVRVVNKLRNRTGRLVHSNYERIYFENIEEAKDYIQKIRHQKKNNKQKNRKYLPIKNHYKIKKSEETNSPFLCSGANKGFSKKLGVYILKGFTDLVALKLINYTIHLHKPKS